MLSIKINGFVQMETYWSEIKYPQTLRILCETEGIAISVNISKVVIILVVEVILYVCSRWQA